MKILTTLCVAVFAACFLYVPTGFAQAPAIEWQKSLGGSDDDVAYSIQQTTDSGYIVAGWSNSSDMDVTGNHRGYDYWVVKLTNLGKVQWQKSLGGSGDDFAYSVQQTKDGGYVVAGQSNSTDGDITGNHGSFDSWIVKLSSIGSIEWQKSLGGSGWDDAHSIEQTSDGGYIVAGSTVSNDGDVTGHHNRYPPDYWITKLTSSGSIQWQESLGGSDKEDAYSVEQTSDGGYILAGSSRSVDGDVTGNHGTSDYWIVKLTSLGGIEWQKSLGGSGEEEAYSIHQTYDGGYVVAGTGQFNDGDVTGNHGSYDYWVVKLTRTGDIQWEQSLGGTGEEYAYSIWQTADSGYVIAGFSNSTDSGMSDYRGGSDDDWILKLSNHGEILWQKWLGGSGGEQPYSIQQTNDGGYIVAGLSESSDGDVTGNHGGSDFWIVKLAPDSTVQLALDTVKLISGDQGTLHLSINVTPKPTNLDTIGFTLTYDPNILTLGDFINCPNGSLDTGICAFHASWIGGVEGNKRAIIVRDPTSPLSTLSFASSVIDIPFQSYISNHDTTVVHITPVETYSNKVSKVYDGLILAGDSCFQPAMRAEMSGGQIDLRIVSITPNPAHTSATLTLQSAIEAEGTIQIVSVTGVVEQSIPVHLQKGVQQIVLQQLPAASGTYEVVVSANGIDASRERMEIVR